MNKEVMFEKAIASFKANWEKFGYSREFSGEIMPRAKWAAVLAAVAEELGKELGLELPLAFELVLLSPVGNASQLGALLVKKGFLVKQDAGANLDDFAAQLLARRAERLGAKADA